MNKNGLKLWGMGVATAVALVGLSFGATGNLMEKWSGGTVNGWTNDAQFAEAPMYCSANIVGTGGQVDLVFKKSNGFLPPIEYDATVGSELASQASFVGNYNALGVKGLAFRFKASNFAADGAEVFFYSAASQRTWKLAITQRLSAGGVGQWITVKIPFDLKYAEADGSKWADGSGNPEAANFSADLGAVDRVGIRLMRHADLAAQTFSIDDYMLLAGDTYTKASGLYDWMINYGIANAASDQDTDKMTAEQEYLANTDPTDNTSNLKFIEISVDAAGHTVLSWESTVGTMYVVERVNSLAADATVETLGTVTATGATQSFTDPGSAGQTWFYKVRVP